MKHVRWSAPSRRDVRRAFEHCYFKVDPDVALQIVERIESKATWLLDFPRAGSPIQLGLRKMLVAGTPYLITYRERTGGISVARIHHSAEDWR